MPSPYARVYPETVLDSRPVWRQLGLKTVHEQYQDLYGHKVSEAPYSGPRGHPQTLREEADAYKRAVRDWRKDEDKAAEIMMRCITPSKTRKPSSQTPRATPNSPPPPPNTKIQRVEVQPALKRRKNIWRAIVHKCFCIPYYE